MNILLARHGNTFGPQDPVVCAGARNDLPLVATGLAQASRLGHALSAQGIRPTAIYCSPLQRTLRYAQVLAELTQFRQAPCIDSRLTEIDYGDWTGLTDLEIATRFGEPALQGWNQKSRWPQTGHWGSSEAQIRREVQEFLAQRVQEHQPQDTFIVVSSNGRLRYFLTLVEGEFEKRIQDESFKVKTGNICQLSYMDNRWSLDYWNQTPRG